MNMKEVEEIQQQRVNGINALDENIYPKSLKNRIIEILWDENLFFSGNLDITYIHKLTETPNLNKKSLQQLKAIEQFFKEPNDKLNTYKLATKSGFATINEFILPIWTVHQHYNENMEFSSDKLYPDFIITLLNFTAALTGKTFDRWKINNKNLISRELSKQEIIESLNTDNNRVILNFLADIIGCNGYVPIGIGEDGYEIYSGFWPGSIRFFSTERWGYNQLCIIPLQL